VSGPKIQNYLLFNELEIPVLDRSAIRLVLKDLKQTHPHDAGTALLILDNVIKNRAKKLTTMELHTNIQTMMMAIKQLQFSPQCTAKYFLGVKKSIPFNTPRKSEPLDPNGNLGWNPMFYYPPIGNSFNEFASFLDEMKKKTARTRAYYHCFTTSFGVWKDHVL